MQKKKIEEAILETQKCLVRYWNKQCRYAIQKLMPDIMWIGAVRNEFMQGRDAVSEDLKITNITNPVCHLLKQEFWCIANDEFTCVIVGRYLVTADTKSTEIIQEEHRVTFVWRLQKDTLKIMHMHISQPIGYLEEGEMFPHKIGKMSYAYLQSLIEECEGRRKHIPVRSVDGHIYFLSESEIEYAEATDHNTKVGILNGSFTARIEWKDFLEKLGKDFIKVHRSFAVNRKYIKILKAREIVMHSGARIPVPVKKKKDVYRQIIYGLCEE